MNSVSFTTSIISRICVWGRLSRRPKWPPTVRFNSLFPSRKRKVSRVIVIQKEPWSSLWELNGMFWSIEMHHRFGLKVPGQLRSIKSSFSQLKYVGLWILGWKNIFKLFFYFVKKCLLMHISVAISIQFGQSWSQLRCVEMHRCVLSCVLVCVGICDLPYITHSITMTSEIGKCKQNSRGKKTFS